MAELDTIVVDIATRVVEPTEDFFIVRPGKKFTLYSEFEHRSAVFLDFPDLDLGVFASAPSAGQTRREMLLRSAAIRDWHLSKGQGEEPSRMLSDYRGKAYRARLGTYASAVDKLYFKLPLNSLIIVPPPSPYADVLIGSLISGPEPLSNFKLYPGESVPARRVKWLGRKSKASFSEAAREKLENPHPLMQLDRGLREEFLKAAYDQFVIGESFTARFRTEADDYSSLDDEDIAAFVNYIAGVIAFKEEKGGSSGSISGEIARDILREFRDRVPELSVNINSPGFLRLLSERVDPLTIAAFMAIAMAGITPAAGQPIQVTNSAAGPQDSCTLVVSKQAEGAMSLMDFDELVKRCHRLKGAATAVQLKSSMQVETKKRRK